MQGGTYHVSQAKTSHTEHQNCKLIANIML